MRRALSIQLPPRRFKRNAGIFSITVIFLCTGFFYLKVNPVLIFSDFHNMKELIGEMWPPNFSVFSDNSSFAFSILQTLAMAFLGTFYGALIATFASFLSANNVMPYRLIRLITRFFISLFRVIPSLVIILIFVISVGPGPFAGVLTLMVTTVGIFGKLFTEVLENIDHSPNEAIYSVGASRLQVVRFSVVPQALPAFISNFFYAFDINMRAAIGLGIFGGGGIGYQLYMSMRVLHHKDAAALIICIVILVLSVEFISNYLRSKILAL
jgi:phosphonate transport system permease protein